MSLLQPVPWIWMAIEQTRMIRLIYHHRERILEPHDHGILKGSVQLLGYQIDGSSSRRLPNWLLMFVFSTAAPASTANPRREPRPRHAKYLALKADLVGPPILGHSLLPKQIQQLTSQRPIVVVNYGFSR